MFQSNKSYDKNKFTDLDFSENLLEESEFTECSFIQCNFTNSTLSSCTFTDCKFEKCIFASTKLFNSSLHTSKFTKCKLMGIDWSKLNTKIGLPLNCLECDLSYSSFANIDISNSVIEYCKIFDVDFTQTIAKKCFFKKSDFENSAFSNTNLIDSDFSESKNYAISIKNNKLKGCKFTYPHVLSLLEIEGIEIVEPTETFFE